MQISASLSKELVEEIKKIQGSVSFSQMVETLLVEAIEQRKKKK